VRGNLDLRLCRITISCNKGRGMSKTSSIGRKTDIVLRLAYTVSSLCTEKRNRDYCGVTYMYHHDTLSHHFVFFYM
jgi:hypothetical protein